MHRIRTMYAAAVAAVVALFVAPAMALAQSSYDTGIDWSSVGTGIINEAKPAILAGLVIMGVALAVTFGRKLFSRVAK